MVKLLCIVEVPDAITEDEAQRTLDTYRENVYRAGLDYVVIYRATPEDKDACDYLLLC